MYASEKENSLEKQEKLIESGMTNIHSADNISNGFMPETWMTKTFYYIAQGQIKLATTLLSHFDHAAYTHPLI